MSLPLTHAGLSAPGISAALDLKFASTLSMTSSSGITPSFSRASSGTYFGSDGLLKYANVNLLQYSEQFENAYWDKSGNVSITSNQVVSPNGYLTGDLLKATAGNFTHYLFRSSLTYSSGNNTLSIFVKYQNHRWFVIQYYDGVKAVEASFDLLNGVTGAIGAGATSVISNAGNGWYRVSLTSSATSGSSSGYFTVALNSSDSASIQTWNATGSESVAIWGAQLETGSTPGTYVPTTNAANSAPRFDHTYNGTSWISRGLLVEEQRTNTIRQSENFVVTGTSWGVNSTGGLTITANSDVAPDGNTTADTIAGAPATGGAWIRAYPVSITSGSYTFSVFIKKTVGATVFPLVYCYSTAGDFGVYVNTNTGALVNYVAGVTQKKCTDCGSYWRVEVSGSVSATVNLNAYIYPAATNDMATFSASLTGSQVYWGAQGEAGAFATSYIPNLSNGSTTRSADVCQITGSDFSSFWNASEGSFAVEYDQIGQTNNASRSVVLFGTSNGSGSYACYYEDYLGNEYWKNYTTDYSLVLGPTSVGQVNRFAGCVKTNDVAATRNGSAVLTDTSATIKTGQVALGIGCVADTSPSTFWNGHIARLRYFNKRLTDKQLEDLCRPEDQLKLDLKFSENLSLTPVVGPTPSFSRASTGTYFNSSGVLTSAAINVPRFDHTYDGTSWISKGLLIEEQRTNVCLWSEDFNNAAWTDVAGRTIYLDAATAPDGNTTADRIILTGSGYSLQKRAYTTTGNHTFSVWLRASSPTVVCIRISNDAGSQSYVVNCNVTTSWQRFSVTGNWSSNPVNFYAGFDQRSVVGGPGASADFFAWGAQLELGAFSTSYIPTTTTSVVRSADVCQITGEDFSGFYNQSEGSVIADYDRTGVDNSKDSEVFNFTNSTGTHQYYIDAYGGSEFSLFYTGAVTQATLTLGSPKASGISSKTSVAYRSNDFAATRDGGSIVSDLSGLVPTVDRAYFGSGISNFWLNGHISRIRYYAIRLPNRLLIAKSQ